MYDPTKIRYRHLNFKSNTTYRRFVQDDKDLKQNNINASNKDIPNHGTYGAILFRAEWKSKREEILKRDFNINFK